ncbi:hypothetical protein [Candidatus Borrarchaeum sp.]|uniref:hypothetical protein n=1 Tax=Candidatus Borrarchaeum sp. TaxID=2846742 RepID=UPI00257DC2FD|nr:hypothetical protein [Candidatus Borrarchaeum sp.]
MSKQKIFSEYCEICKTTIKHPIKKEQLHPRGGGLYSGIFLHKCKENEEIHAVLSYFDADLAHRGTEGSKLFHTDLSLENLKSSALPDLKDEIELKQDIKMFYEWLINEYIFYFKSIKLATMKQVGSILEEILNKLKLQTNIYNNFKLISDKTSDKIICDLETKDAQKIKTRELKKAYQTLFNQIRWQFRENDEHDAFESSKKLGFKMVRIWRDLLRFGVSEDMFRSLEVLLTLRDFSDI